MSEKLENLNVWIDAEVERLLGYFDLVPSFEEQSFLRAKIADLVRQAVLKVIGDKVNLINNLANEIHARNVDAGWWTDLKTGEDLHGKRNIGELLCLVHSEISEAMEGHRKNLPDDKLPHRPMFRVELIDALIRILDILGADNREHPAGELFVEKLEFNAVRPDHKRENRLKAGGKIY